MFKLASVLTYSNAVRGVRAVSDPNPHPSSQGLVSSGTRTSAHNSQETMATKNIHKPTEAHEDFRNAMGSQETARAQAHRRSSFTSRPRRQLATLRLQQEQQAGGALTHEIPPHARSSSNRRTVTLVLPVALTGRLATFEAALTAVKQQHAQQQIKLNLAQVVFKYLHQAHTDHVSSSQAKVMELRKDHNMVQRALTSLQVEHQKVFSQKHEAVEALAKLEAVHMATTEAAAVESTNLNALQGQVFMLTRAVKEFHIRETERLQHAAQCELRLRERLHQESHQVDILKAHLAAAQEKEAQSVKTVETLEADLAATQKVASTLKTDLAAAQQGEATARKVLTEMSAAAERTVATVLQVTGTQQERMWAQMAATAADLGTVQGQLSMALAEGVESSTAAEAATRLAREAEQTAAVQMEKLKYVCAQVDMELQDACNTVRDMGGQLSGALTKVVELRSEAGAVAAHAAEEGRAVAVQLAAVQKKAELAQDHVRAEQADKADMAAEATQQLQSMERQLSDSATEMAALRKVAADAVAHAEEREAGYVRATSEVQQLKETNTTLLQCFIIKAPSARDEQVASRTPVGVSPLHLGRQSCVKLMTDSAASCSSTGSSTCSSPCSRAGSSPCSRPCSSTGSSPMVAQADAAAFHACWSSSAELTKLKGWQLEVEGMKDQLSEAQMQIAVAEERWGELRRLGSKVAAAAAALDVDDECEEAGPARATPQVQQLGDTNTKLQQHNTPLQCLVDEACDMEMQVSSPPLRGTLAKDQDWAAHQERESSATELADAAAVLRHTVGKGEGPATPSGSESEAEGSCGDSQDAGWQRVWRAISC